jgi:undecaprenyl pyrophosphate phosphatase UppP
VLSTVDENTLQYRGSQNKNELLVFKIYGNRVLHHYSVSIVVAAVVAVVVVNSDKIWKIWKKNQLKVNRYEKYG